jgi:hypothetical protein
MVFRLIEIQVKDKKLVRECLQILISVAVTKNNWMKKIFYHYIIYILSISVI